MIFAPMPFCKAKFIMSKIFALGCLFRAKFSLCIGLIEKNRPVFHSLDIFLFSFLFLAILMSCKGHKNLIAPKI